KTGRWHPSFCCRPALAGTAPAGLAVIARLLQRFAAPAIRPDRHTLDLACAALLTEIMRADHQLNAPEQAGLQQTLRSLFHLNEQETAELMQEALQHKIGRAHV